MVLAEHQLQIRALNVTAVRTRIEFKLGVETTAEPLRAGMWVVRFRADKYVNLDFLRPDVLPPKEWEWTSHSPNPRDQ